MSILKDKATTTVVISELAWSKQRSLIELCDAEIGWFGSVEEKQFGPDERALYVADIYVPEQEVSTASVYQDSEELVAWLMKNPELSQNLNYYGHSHVNGPVFTSSVDLKQIRDWKEFDLPFMINFIGNKGDDWQCRIDNFQAGISAPVDLVVEQSEATLEWAYEEIRDNVKIIKHKWQNNRIVGEEVVKSKGAAFGLRAYIELDKGLPTF